MTAKGRIAAAIYRRTTARVGHSPYFTVGREIFPKLFPPLGILSPPKHGFLARPSACNQFSRFCRTHSCVILLCVLVVLEVLMAAVQSI